MYRVKVTGEYVARSGIMDKEKIKKSYVVDGVIPTMTAALSIVKNKLLGPALAKKYPDYVTFLTYNIVEITPLTEEAKEKMSRLSVNFMDRPTLLQHIKDNALPVDARYYPDLFKLREAVQHAKEDPEGYSRQFELRKEDLSLDLQMAAANPDLFQTPVDQTLAASISLKTPNTKASTTKDLAKKTGDRLAGLEAEQIRDGDMAAAPEAGEL